jgi:cytochrome P450
MSARITPPKPPARPDRVSGLRYLLMFRRDILSAQPARLYRAWMAEYRTPFFRSFLCNDPDLVDLVLRRRPDDFPKSGRVREGLAPLLGQSVFVTNGEDWKRQRRIIDPAFEGGRLRDTFPHMLAAVQASVVRLRDRAGPGAAIEIEEPMSHLAADIIFRALFSIPIENAAASEVFAAFRAHQRTQPVVNLGAFLPLPRWFPRLISRRARQTAARIRALIGDLTAARMAEVAAGTAPDDLATKIITTADPVTGARFDAAEMVDQVAIFFLAGHETSASGMAWALYLLACDPEVQDRAAAEAQALPDVPAFSDLSRLRLVRDVFRETLRLYPPVPLMVREAARPETLRGRAVPAGAQIVLSPFHLQRHQRLWADPDVFDPDRWAREDTREAARCAYMPFSAGPRVCTGAGFAMAEGVLALAGLLRAFRFLPADGPAPVPVAHLTLRARDGIRLRVAPRA